MVVVTRVYFRTWATQWAIGDGLRRNHNCGPDTYHHNFDHHPLSQPNNLFMKSSAWRWYRLATTSQPETFLRAVKSHDSPQNWSWSMLLRFQVSNGNWTYWLVHYSTANGCIPYWKNFINQYQNYTRISIFLLVLVLFWYRFMKFFK